MKTYCGMDSLCHRNRLVVVQNIQENTGKILQITLKTVEALVLAQDYAKCYPYMNPKQLINILLEALENFCALRSLDKSQVQRKYNLIKADSRADKTHVASLESLLNELKGM